VPPNNNVGTNRNCRISKCVTGTTATGRTGYRRVAMTMIACSPAPYDGMSTGLGLPVDPLVNTIAQYGPAGRGTTG
jgi:hypothetical protein